MEVGKRLKILIHVLGLNVTTFSQEIGLKNNVTILRIIKEGNLPSFKVTYMIKTRYPRLNLNWFIFNEGSMWLKRLKWEREPEEPNEIRVLEKAISKQLNSKKYQYNTLDG